MARATYQSLMDQMGYESPAGEHPRAAGAEAGRDVGPGRAGAAPDPRRQVRRHRAEGRAREGRRRSSRTGRSPAPNAGGDGPPRRSRRRSCPEDEDDAAVKPVGAAADALPKPKDTPVSTYSIWAPFDGTILDREMIVPGVAVDTTHRIFTLANLSTVWVEASVHESDFEHARPQPRREDPLPVAGLPRSRVRRAR